MAKYNGTALQIQISDVAITLNNSVTLSTNTSEVECTSKDSSGFKEILPGTRDWSMSGSAYIDHASAQGLDQAITSWLANTTVSAEFTNAVVSDPNYTGDAYFTNIEQSGELDGTAEWTFTLSGSGALSTGTILA